MLTIDRSQCKQEYVSETLSSFETPKDCGTGLAQILHEEQIADFGV
jgi:hypothetical protein